MGPSRPKLAGSGPENPRKSVVPQLPVRFSEVPFPRGSAGSKAPEVEGAAFWGAEVVDLAEIYRSVGFAEEQAQRDFYIAKQGATFRDREALRMIREPSPLVEGKTACGTGGGTGGTGGGTGGTGAQRLE